MGGGGGGLVVVGGGGGGLVGGGIFFTEGTVGFVGRRFGPLSSSCSC